MEIVDLLVLDKDGKTLTKPKNAAGLVEYLHATGWEYALAGAASSLPLVSGYTWITYRDEDGFRHLAAIMVEKDEKPATASLWPEEDGYPPALVLDAEEIAESALDSYIDAWNDWKAGRDQDKDDTLLDILNERAGRMQDASAALALADRLCRGFYGEKAPPELKAWRAALREVDKVLDANGSPDGEVERLFSRSDELAKWVDARWP